MESTDRSLFYQKAVLGSVFADAAVMSTVVERVSPHMFEDANLGLIFRGMVSLFNKGIGIDPLLIDREMKLLDEELYSKMNGLNYDMELFTCVLDSSNVEEYARLVKDDYLRRRLSALYMTLMSSLGDTSKDINLIVGLMYKGVEELFNEDITGDQARSIQELVQENWKDFIKNREEGLESRAIATGFAEFDKLTGGGFFPGELYTMAARPSEGKSMITLFLLKEIAQKGHYVRMVNSEMADYDTANRTIAMLTEINSNSLRKGVLTEAEENQVKDLIDGKLQDVKMDVRFMGNARMESIVTETMLATKRGKCDVLAIDYLQMIEGASDAKDNQDTAIGKNINMLKALAVKCKIPIIVVSQMNREIERRGDKYKLPVLADLRSSGVIEQTSDVVSFLYRPDRLGLTEDEDGSSLIGISKLLVLKNRHGAIGQVRFHHNSSFTKLWDYIPFFNKKK